MIFHRANFEEILRSRWIAIEWIRMLNLLAWIVLIFKDVWWQNKNGDDRLEGETKADGKTDDDHVYSSRPKKIAIDENVEEIASQNRKYKNLSMPNPEVAT